MSMSPVRQQGLLDSVCPCSIRLGKNRNGMVEAMSSDDVHLAVSCVERADGSQTQGSVH